MATKTVCDNCGKDIDPEHCIKIERVRSYSSYATVDQAAEYDLCSWKCVDSLAFSKVDD